MSDWRLQPCIWQHRRIDDSSKQTKMDSTAEKLNLAVLRLAAELRVGKVTKQHHGDNEKLLWECHKAELDYIENLEKYSGLLRTAEKMERAAVFQVQLKNAKQKLDGNQINVDVVQKLVHQLEGRNQNCHIDVEKLKSDNPFVRINAGSEAVLASQDEVFNENIVKELDDFHSHSNELKSRIDQLQNVICAASDDAIRATSDLIHDVI